MDTPPNGRYDCSFGSMPSYTTVTGALNISSGALTIATIVMNLKTLYCLYFPFKLFMELQVIIKAVFSTLMRAMPENHLLSDRIEACLLS